MQTNPNIRAPSSLTALAFNVVVFLGLTFLYNLLVPRQTHHHHHHHSPKGPGPTLGNVSTSTTTTTNAQCPATPCTADAQPPKPSPRNRVEDLVPFGGSVAQFPFDHRETTLFEYRPRKHPMSCVTHWWLGGKTTAMYGVLRFYVDGCCCVSCAPHLDSAGIHQSVPSGVNVFSRGLGYSCSSMSLSMDSANRVLRGVR